MDRSPLDRERGLWWATAIILATGAGIAALIQREAGIDPVMHDKIRVVAMITIIAAGLCLITATARWWMRH